MLGNLTWLLRWVVKKLPSRYGAATIHSHYGGYINTQIWIFILPFKKIVDKLINYSLSQRKKALETFSKGKGAPEKKSLSPRELHQKNKATLQEIQVIFKVQYEVMYYQISQVRRIAYCYMLLIQEIAENHECSSHC